MAQPQQSVDVHQDELCPPNKRYALMDANKKVNLDNPLCPDESRIIENIFQNHPLRFSIAASSLVLWIYLRQFWDTLQEDGSKYKLKFMLDRKELTLTHDDFRTIFHLPQATDNNHDHFVPAPQFFEMVPFYINNLGFTLELNQHRTLRQPVFYNRGRRCARCSQDLYAEVFGVDVPTTQSQPIESTQGTHRTTTSPRTPNPKTAEGESSAHEVLLSLDFSIPPRRSTRLTPPTLIPTTDEADDLILQDTLQVSLAEQKSREELEATQNVEKVKEHLMAEEIEKLVEGSENVEENVEVTSSPLRNDEIKLIPALVEKREKGKEIEESRNTPSLTTTRSLRTHSTLISSDTKKLQELTETNTIPSSSTPSSSSSKLSATNRLLSLFKSKPERFKRYNSFFDELQGKYGYLFGHLTTRFLPRRKFNELARHLQDIMMESLPKMVDERIKKILQTQVPLHVAQGIILEEKRVKRRDQDDPHDDPHDDAHLEGENSVKRRKITEHGTFELGGSLFGQDYESESGPSTSGNQEQYDNFDF
ncbi:hypothetical protein Tco_0545326 [Tanacetum coccineum]